MANMLTFLSTGGCIYFLENSGNFWNSQGNLREFFSTALVDTMSLQSEYQNLCSDFSRRTVRRKKKMFVSVRFFLQRKILELPKPSGTQSTFSKQFFKNLIIPFLIIMRKRIIKCKFFFLLIINCYVIIIRVWFKFNQNCTKKEVNVLNDHEQLQVLTGFNKFYKFYILNQ